MSCRDAFERPGVTVLVSSTEANIQAADEAASTTIRVFLLTR